MTRSRVRTGIAGCLLLAATAAGAQDAGGQTAAQPGATACSGLLCLFRPRGEAAQQPAAAAAQAGGEVSATAAAATDGKPPAAAPAREAPVVTIAADPADLPRLKSLAAIISRQRIRFVRLSRDEGEFTVAPMLDDAAGSRTLRLYSEQMHVIAGPTVHSFADLRDKVVSFGPADGPARAIARRAFAALAVPVKETPLDDDNALDGLATGDIDAVVVLAPQPAARLARLRAPGLHLLAWPDGTAAPAGTSLAVVPAASYKNCAKPGDATRVLAVDAVLTLTAKGAKLPAARSLFASLNQRSAALVASLVRHGFDRLGADLDARTGRRVASDERR